MALIFRAEGFPKTETTVPVQPQLVDFCQIPCHLRPAYYTEPSNPATDTSCRKVTILEVMVVQMSKNANN